MSLINQPSPQTYRSVATKSPTTPIVIKASAYDFLAWIAALAGVAYQLIGILQSKVLAGQDMAGHFYLFKRALLYLQQAQLSDYNIGWFAGYPEFSLTSIFPYLLPAGLYYIGFGALSPELCFNAVVFLIPLLLLCSVGWSAASFFGARAGSYAILLASLGLTSLAPLQRNSLGISELLQAGHFTSYLALPFVVLFIGLLERTRKTLSFLAALLAGATLATLLCIGIEHAIFALFALLLWWLVGPRARFAPTFLILSLATLLSVLAWLPLLTHLPYASEVTPAATGSVSDTVLSFFPDLQQKNFENIKGLTSITLDTQGSASERAKSAVIQISDKLSGVPFYGALLLIGTIGGLIIILKQGRAELFLPFLVPIFFLSRKFGVTIPEVPWHYAYYVQPLLALQLLLVAAALVQLSKRKLPRFLISLLLLTSTAYSLYISYDPHRPANLEQSARASHHFFLEQYPDYPSAMKLVDYLRSKPAGTRVVEESASEDMDTVGTLHFFAGMLSNSPEKNYEAQAIEVLNGMGVRDSPTGYFIDQILSTIPSHAIQNRTTLSLQQVRADQKDLLLVRQLELFGADYFVVSNAELSQKLQSIGIPLENAGTFGKFSLFKLTPKLPKIFESDFKPFLFIDEGGPTFRAFTEQWLLAPELFDSPVFYSVKGPEKLKASEISRLRGVIVSANVPSERLDRAVKYWRGQNKEVLAILSSQAPVSVQEGVDYIGDFGTATSLERLKSALAQNKITTPKALQLAPTFNSKISFQSSQTVCLSYSFAPRLLLRGVGHNFFLTTPYFGCFFGTENERLNYQ